MENNAEIELKKAREFFKDDRFAAVALGAEIDAVKDGFARCSVELCDRHKNAAGRIMGGAIFTLADFAFAVASNENGMTVTSLSSSICFLSAAKGERLTAEASRVKCGKSTCCYDISVFDELGTQVAKVTTTGFILRREEQN